MNSNNSNLSRAAPARGFMAHVAMLAMGVGLLASPAAAAPFAYVTNESVPGTVSVIDTATNTALTGAGLPIPVGSNPSGVAVTQDGQHAYVTNSGSGTVSVIATATNTVVATITVGSFPVGVAITPDGTHAYVTNESSGTVSVIDTASNTVVATVPVGSFPIGVAVTPDGKHAYVTNSSSNTVSVIATATNAVLTGTGFPIAVGTGPIGIAVTPDGTHAYVANSIDDTVSVIATATNTVVATVTVGTYPSGVAITADGKDAYVANEGFHIHSPPMGSVPETVSVIATASNTVVASIGLPLGIAAGVGIVPPPPGVPFLAFNAKLTIQFGSISTKDAFGFGSNFILSSTAPAINPITEPVTLQVGSFATRIPPGSFKKQADGTFTFRGTIHGVGLDALIKQTGSLRYVFETQARGANLTGTVNTVYTTLTIGGDSGATSVTAEISH
jgi:YVTN family beta-propeller protein